MTVIDEIGADQLAELPGWLDEAVAIGSNTDPADRNAAEAGVRLAYERAGLRPPTRFTWLDSPYQGCLEAASRYADRSASNGGPAGIQLADAGPGALRVRLRQRARDLVKDRLRARLAPGVRATVRARIGDPLMDRVGARLGDQVGDQVLDQVTNSMRGIVAAAMPGQHDYWLLYAAVYDRLGVDVSELDGLLAVARNAGWWWAFDDEVIITERPNRIRRDDLGRLHCPDGPALQYRDGWSVYVWKGGRVPASLITTTWTYEQIMNEREPRVRRCAIDKMGWDAFVKMAKLVQVGESVPDPGNPGHFLSLYELPNMIDNLQLRLLICDNGTPEADGERRRFGLTVPATIPDALSAAAWSFGVEPQAYARLERGA